MQGGDVPYGVQSASSGWNDISQTAHSSCWYNVSTVYQFYTELYLLRRSIQQQVQLHHTYNYVFSSPSPALSFPNARCPEPLTDNLAFINSLNHEELLLASNTVYINCLDSLAKKDQEISTLKDHVFELQYVPHFVNACTV